MQIRPLLECPDHLETVIDWHVEEWGYLHPGEDRATRRKKILATEVGQLGRPPIPVMFLGQIDGAAIGTVALVASDLASHPHLSPWMASVYVRKDLRGQGHGSRLIRHLMQHAQDIGIGPLYLYTPDAESFYARHGWTEFETSEVAGKAITIMKWDAQTGA